MSDTFLYFDTNYLDFCLRAWRFMNGIETPKKNIQNRQKKTGAAKRKIKVSIFGSQKFG